MRFVREEGREPLSKPKAMRMICRVLVIENKFCGIDQSPGKVFGSCLP